MLLRPSPLLRDAKDVLRAAMDFVSPPPKDWRNKRFLIAYLSEQSRRLQAAWLRLGEVPWGEIDRRLLNDFDVVLAIARTNPLRLDKVPPAWRDNKGIALVAVRTYAASLRIFSERLRDDSDVFVVAASTNTEAVGMGSHRLRTEPATARAVLSANPDATEAFLPAALSTRDVALAAVGTRPDQLRHLPDTMQRDPEVVKAAVKKDQRALAFAHKDLWADLAFMKHHFPLDPRTAAYVLQTMADLLGHDVAVQKLAADKQVLQRITGPAAEAGIELMKHRADLGAARAAIQAAHAEVRRRWPRPG